MTLVQISQRTGVVKRVKEGEEPFIDLHLKPGQRVISIDFRPAIFPRRDRKTVDWHWTAVLEWRDPDRETEEGT
jgi:hypothetical protein